MRGHVSAHGVQVEGPGGLTAVVIVKVAAQINLGGGIEFVAVSPPKQVSSGETAESHPPKATEASKLCHRHGVAYWIS